MSETRCAFREGGPGKNQCCLPTDHSGPHRTSGFYSPASLAPPRCEHNVLLTEPCDACLLAGYERPASLVPEGTPPTNYDKRALVIIAADALVRAASEGARREVFRARRDAFITALDAALAAAPAVRPEGPPPRSQIDADDLDFEASMQCEAELLEAQNALVLLANEFERRSIPFIPAAEKATAAARKSITDFDRSVAQGMAIAREVFAESRRAAPAVRPEGPGTPVTANDGSALTMRGTGEGMLTEEQFKAGMSEARRIVNSAVGYRFGGDLVPYANEFRSLALRALDEARARLAERRGIGEGMTIRGDMRVDSALAREACMEAIEATIREVDRQNKLKIPLAEQAIDYADITDRAIGKAANTLLSCASSSGRAAGEGEEDFSERISGTAADDALGKRAAELQHQLAPEDRRVVGDLVKWTWELRAALSRAAARLASSSGRAAEPLPTLTDRHADAIEFVVMALDKVAPRTGGANLRGRAKDAARIIRENCRRASETPDEEKLPHRPPQTEDGA